MKKIVLLVFILLLCVVPCYAIEPNGLFSINHTVWKIVGTSNYLGFMDGYFYFCEGDEYDCIPIGNYAGCIVCFLDTVHHAGIFSISGYAIPFLGVGSVDICKLGSCSKTPIRKYANYWYPE